MKLVVPNLVIIKIRSCLRRLPIYEHLLNFFMEIHIGLYVLSG